VTQALAEQYRLLSYRPELNPIERFWKVFRRATPNRLFETPAELEASVRTSMRYVQTVRSRVRQLLNGRPNRDR
jgi:hypothetical protein